MGNRTISRGVLYVSSNLICNSYEKEYQPRKILQAVFSDDLFKRYTKGVTSFSNPRYADLTSIEFGVWDGKKWERTHIDRATHFGVQTYNFLNSAWKEEYMDTNYEIGIQRKISRRTELMFVVYPIDKLEGKINAEKIRQLFCYDYEQWERWNKYDHHCRPYPALCKE